MFKKILLAFTIISLIGCNATKPVIVTSKKAPLKQRTEIVQTTKKTAAIRSNTTKQILSKPVKQQQQ